jgi:hypothetical protein
VRTRHSDFTGFLQWDREETLGHDELVGHTTNGELGLRFDSIRSIARHSPSSSLVALLNGLRSCWSTMSRRQERRSKRARRC